MKEIKLTQGYIALVDDEDYEALAKFKWRVHQSTPKHHYAARTIYIDGKNKNLFMHRVILGITDSDIFVDHADGNCLNNQKANLRSCNKTENTYNSIRESKHGFKGITQRPNGKWVALARKGGRGFYAGTFDTKEEAALAYNTKAIELFGEFAKLNQV